METSPREQGRGTLAFTKSVFLVGFMGAGKSTLARRLALAFGSCSVDMDVYIERMTSCRIATLFEEQGEEYFRGLEAEVLRRMTSEGMIAVVACGGGVVESEESCALLRDAFVVYLKAPAAESLDRISNKNGRPLAHGDFETLYAHRVPKYEEVANVTVNVSGKQPKEVFSAVVAALKKEGVLCPRK